MIQTLDVISINLWSILISLGNLLLIFLILKKFLWKPVKKVMQQRQDMVDKQFADAAEAQKEAVADKAAWADKLAGADNEADARLKAADATARQHGDRIVSDARTRAEDIIRQAKNEAALEKTRAEAAIKEEIVQVSTALAEKMLEREIATADHQQLIDSFLDEIGDAHD